MTTNETPWPGLEDVVRRLGQSLIETRFATARLLALMPELEQDPSPENWDRVIPIQQYLYMAGVRFEIAVNELLASDDEWVDLVADLVGEMRQTLVTEAEWCGARMRLLTDRLHQPAWPFPFHVPTIT